MIVKTGKIFTYSHIMCLLLVMKKKYKTKDINLASILKDLYFKVKKFSFYFYFKLRASFKIPCLSAPTESTPESSPVKICKTCKTTPR